MHSTVATDCALMSTFRGKLVQNFRRNTANLSPLTTDADYPNRSTVRKTLSSPQFHRTLCSAFSTAILHTFSDQMSRLYPLSTGPTISKDKINLYIVERSS